MTRAGQYRHRGLRELLRSDAGKAVVGPVVDDDLDASHQESPIAVLHSAKPERSVLPPRYDARVELSPDRIVPAAVRLEPLRPLYRAQWHQGPAHLYVPLDPQPEHPLDPARALRRQRSPRQAEFEYPCSEEVSDESLPQPRSQL